MTSKPLLSSLKKLTQTSDSRRQNSKPPVSSSLFKDFSHYWNIIIYQTRVDIKNEASRGYLGILWWFLDPLFQIMVFQLLAIAGLRFVSLDRLVVGIGIWRFFGGSVSIIGNSIMGNRSIMNQVALPIWIFPIQALLLNLIKFAALLFVIFSFLWAKGVAFTLHYLSFPIVLVVYILTSFAFALILAVFVPFLPDLRSIISNLIMLLFFTSGVFFDISTLPAKAQNIMFINPFAVIMTSFKHVLTGNQGPLWDRLFLIGLASSLVIALGFRLLHRFRHVYPKLQRG